MKRALSVFLLLGCATPRPASPPPAPPAPPPVASPPNLEIRVSEVIERADLDGLSYAAVFIDGVAAGQTNIAARSQEKAWSAAVEPMNHAVRVELWILPGTGEWSRLEDEQQPRERFVRAEGGTRAILVLRRHPSGRYDFDVTREER